jgi:hypothetical protein
MSQAPLLQHTDSDEESIMETFHDLAEALRLPELDWDFIYYDGEVLAQGHPRSQSDIAACTRWARFLGMSATVAEADSRGECWLGFNGPWTLEIVAQVR